MTDDLRQPEFSVAVFFADDTHSYALRDIDFPAAFDAVMRLVKTLLAPSNRGHGIVRIIITDGGDDTVFEWLPAEGITFPSPHSAQEVEAYIAAMFSDA